MGKNIARNDKKKISANKITATYNKTQHFYYSRNSQFLPQTNVKTVNKKNKKKLLKNILTTKIHVMKSNI